MPKPKTLVLKPGDVAPNFTAPLSGGGQITLADLRGQAVALFFYPKDDTPGCTKEACGFRDLTDAFEKRNARILGVSVDPLKKHDKFVEKYRLTFPLVSDEDKAVVNAYGVYGEKKFMGRTYQGVFRVTFLIGPDGRILRIWDAVKPEGHAQEVLDALAGEV